MILPKWQLKWSRIELVFRTCIFAFIVNLFIQPHTGLQPNVHAFAFNTQKNVDTHFIWTCACIFLFSFWWSEMSNYSKMLLHRILELVKWLAALIHCIFDKLISFAILYSAWHVFGSIFGNTIAFQFRRLHSIFFQGLWKSARILLIRVTEANLN